MFFPFQLLLPQTIWKLNNQFRSSNYGDIRWGCTLHIYLNFVKAWINLLKSLVVKGATQFSFQFTATITMFSENYFGAFALIANSVLYCAPQQPLFPCQLIPPSISYLGTAVKTAGLAHLCMGCFPIYTYNRKSYIGHPPADQNTQGVSKGSWTAVV